MIAGLPLGRHRAADVTTHRRLRQRSGAAPAGTGRPLRPCLPRTAPVVPVARCVPRRGNARPLRAALAPRAGARGAGGDRPRPSGVATLRCVAERPPCGTRARRHGGTRPRGPPAAPRVGGGGGQRRASPPHAPTSRPSRAGRRGSATHRRPRCRSRRQRDRAAGSLRRSRGSSRWSGPATGSPGRGGGGRGRARVPAVPLGRRVARARPVVRHARMAVTAAAPKGERAGLAVTRLGHPGCRTQRRHATALARAGHEVASCLWTSAPLAPAAPSMAGASAVIVGSARSGDAGPNCEPADRGGATAAARRAAGTAASPPGNGRDVDGTGCGGVR